MNRLLTELAIFLPLTTYTFAMLKGTLAFHLDLSLMSTTLRQMQAPVQGEYFVVDRHGQVILHPHTGKILKTLIAPSLMNKMTNGEGAVYDKKNNSWIYYYSFTTLTGPLFLKFQMQL